MKEKNITLMARWYMFIAEAKTTMALFFAYMVCIYLILAWASGAAVQSISFALAIQMFAVSILTGFAQRILIPSNNISIPRSIIWGVFSAGVTLAFSLGFGWFAGFAVWCHVVFWGILVLGFGFMVLHLHIRLDAETRALNDQLRRFQEKQDMYHEAEETL